MRSVSCNACRLLNFGKVGQYDSSPAPPKMYAGFFHDPEGGIPKPTEQPCSDVPALNGLGGRSADLAHYLSVKGKKLIDFRDAYIIWSSTILSSTANLGFGFLAAYSRWIALVK